MHKIMGNLIVVWCISTCMGNTVGINLYMVSFDYSTVFLSMVFIPKSVEEFQMSFKVADFDRQFTVYLISAYSRGAVSV